MDDYDINLVTKEYVDTELNQKQDILTSTSTITIDTLKANTIESQDGDLEINANTHITDGKVLSATSIDMQYGGTNKGIIQGLADITDTSNGDVAVNKNYIDSIIGDINTILSTIVEVSE